jgi:hypothetical protein
MKFSPHAPMLALALICSFPTNAGLTTTSASPSPIMGAPDAIKICNGPQSGPRYDDIALSSISSVEVSLFGELPSNSADFNAEYTGDQIINVLAPLNLSVPDRPGYVGTIFTGKIILHFRFEGEERQKVLNIGNSRLVQDNDCPDVVYYPSKTLDRSWLPQE